MKRNITMNIFIDDKDNNDYYESMRLLIDEYLKQQIELLNFYIKKIDNDEHLKENQVRVVLHNDYSSIPQEQNIQLLNISGKKLYLLKWGIWRNVDDLFNELNELNELPTEDDIPKNLDIGEYNSLKSCLDYINNYKEQLEKGE